MSADKFSYTQAITRRGRGTGRASLTRVAEPTSSSDASETATSASVQAPQPLQRASVEPPNFFGTATTVQSRSSFSFSPPEPSPSPQPPGSQAQINALLSKALRGELIDTQFFLFSTRSKTGGVATKPQPLFSNDAVLTASSPYFHILLFPGKSIDDPAFVDLSVYSTCEEAISLDDYGYASDSDLEDEDELGPTAQSDAEPGIQASGANGPQRITPGRRVMVTDTAFKTWEALLFYLYTGDIIFAPLRSQPSSTPTCESLYTPVRCSPKSMYRLACKVKHEALQVKALAAMRSSLTEHNIVHELSSSLPVRFPAILEMEVQILFQHFSTPSVMRDFPALVKKIADTTDVPHGADILIQLHEKFIKQHYPMKVSPPSVLSLADSKMSTVFSDLKSKPMPEKGWGVFGDVDSKPKATKSAFPSSISAGLSPSNFPIPSE